KTKEDLCNQSKIGLKLFDDFVCNRIKYGKFSIWSPMKKYKLSTWRKAGKELKVKANEKVYELKEDRSLFARMMLVCKTRPEINIKNAIGIHEFSVVPRSLFAADGTMFHCSNKSVLMSILEKLPEKHSSNSANIQPDANVVLQPTCNIQEPTVHVDNSHRVRVDIVDGMAELQSLNKPEWIKNCQHLANHFTAKMFEKYSESDELRLIFDRYDVPLSLKMATRVRRQGGQPPISYHITDSTNISRVPMKKLLSH
ncbi:hypothetical protein QZH41_015388, partial [Actinostola sp. cb2023]